MGTINRPHKSARCLTPYAKAKRCSHSIERSQARFDRVSNLIEGFETPYGMELISSVHWVVTQVNQSAPS